MVPCRVGMPTWQRRLGSAQSPPSGLFAPLIEKQNRRFMQGQKQKASDHTFFHLPPPLEQSHSRPPARLSTLSTGALSKHHATHAHRHSPPCQTTPAPRPHKGALMAWPMAPIKTGMRPSSQQPLSAPPPLPHNVHPRPVLCVRAASRLPR